jgi:uncharacterized damage-inducible protein DinB
MQALIKITVREIEAITGEAVITFSNLSPSELNWKPQPQKWSIAQCLHHLIVSNSTYFPQLDEIIAGKHHNSFYQNIGTIARFFGDYLIKETGAVVGKSMKSPSAFVPSHSDIPGTIVADFGKHQAQLAQKIELLDKMNLDETVLYSPALKIITYSLRDLLVILAGHERRHLTQAKNVLLAMKGDPKIISAANSV